MANWLTALSRTRERIAGAFAAVLAGPGQGTPVGDDIQEMLLLADVPVRLADHLVDEVASAPSGSPPMENIRCALLEALGPVPQPDWLARDALTTILLVGVNGSGKTTTSAKLARHVLGEGRKPLLGATDTFRAAGAEQLRLWAGRIGCDVVVGAPGADAAAVAYDALDAATARNADVLILDTAGRMHTREPLMNELQKMARALAKRQPGAPEETWLVLDGSMGQNAVAQARTFHEAVTLTGIIATKLDGSSRAGFLFGIGQELGVPIRYVGLGEGEHDLVAFEPTAFVDGLLGLEPAAEGQVS